MSIRGNKNNEEKVKRTIYVVLSAESADCAYRGTCCANIQLKTLKQIVISLFSFSALNWFIAQTSEAQHKGSPQHNKELHQKTFDSFFFCWYIKCEY